MKKSFIALACVFLLAGCSLGDSKNKKDDSKKEEKTSQSTKKREKTSRMDPKKAVEALINSVVYEKDLDKLEAAFDIDPADLEGTIEDSFVSGFTESTEDSDAIKKQAHDLWATLMEQVKAKTTYTVTVVKKDAKKPVLRVDVTGLDMNSIEKAFQDRLVKEAIKNPSITEDEDALPAFIFDVYRQELANIQATDTSKSFEIMLSPDPLNKKVWTFDDNDAFSSMLGSFFFSSTSDDADTTDNDLDSEIADEVE